MPTYRIRIGDKAFDVNSQQELTDAQAYAIASQQAATAPEKKYQAAPVDTSPDAIAKATLAEMPGWQQGIVNLGAGMMKPIRGVGQLLGMVNEQDILEARQRDEALAKNTPGGGFGQFVGEVVPSMVTGAGVGAGVVRGANAIRGAASALPGALGRGIGAVAGSPVVQAAATGAADAALTQGVAPGETRLGQAAQGAAFGAGGQKVAGGLAKTLGGLVKPSDEAAALMARGIQPTIGQAADPTTRRGLMLKRFEESVQSVPVAGDIINYARNRALKEGQADIMGQVLPPNVRPRVLGKTTGNEAVDRIATEYTNAYSKVLSGAKVKPDITTVDNMRRVLDDPSISLTPDQQAKAMKYLDQMVTPKIIDPNTGNFNVLDGEMFKRIHSDLNQQARKWASSSSQQERALGDAYSEIADVWRSGFNAKTAGARASQQLDEIDKQYAKFVRVKNAAGSAAAAAKEGEFTPRQLLGAIRQAEPEKGRFARGGSLLQEEAGQLAKVLGTGTPDSGTPTRMLTNALLTGAGASAFGILPAVAKASAVTGALYTRAGQKALLGGFDKQAQMRQAFKRFSKQYPGVVAGGAQSLQED